MGALTMVEGTPPTKMEGRGLPRVHTIPRGWVRQEGRGRANVGACTVYVGTALAAATRHSPAPCPLPRRAVGPLGRCHRSRGCIIAYPFGRKGAWDGQRRRGVQRRRRGLTSPCLSPSSPKADTTPHSGRTGTRAGTPRMDTRGWMRPERHWRGNGGVHGRGCPCAFTRSLPAFESPNSVMSTSRPGPGPTSPPSSTLWTECTGWIRGEGARASKLGRRGVWREVKQPAAVDEGKGGKGAGQPTERALLHDLRVGVGLVAKRFLDWGRVRWLREQGCVTLPLPSPPPPSPPPPPPPPPHPAHDLRISMILIIRTSIITIIIIMTTAGGTPIWFALYRRTCPRRTSFCLPEAPKPRHGSSPPLPPKVHDPA